MEKLIIKYRSEEELLNAIDFAKEKGIEIEEVLVPYPSHEVIHAMGHKTRITQLAFLYGVLSVCFIMGFLFYTSVYDWPLNIGGKPSASLPSFVTLSVVVTILLVTLSSLFTFNFVAKIYPGKKMDYPNLGATDDQFVLIIGEDERERHKAWIEHLIACWPEVEYDKNEKFKSS